MRAVPPGVIDVPPTKERKLARKKRSLETVPRRTRHGWISSLLVDAWRRALDVSERDIAAFVPTTDVCEVGEALLAGATSVEAAASCSGLSEARVRDVICNAIAMSWIAQQVHEHFRRRIAFVDAALYGRAVAGDIPAIRLWYERHDSLDHAQKIDVRHRHSIAFDPSTLSTEDLRRLVQDNGRLLASSTKVIDVDATVLPTSDPNQARCDVSSKNRTSKETQPSPPLDPLPYEASISSIQALRK